MPVHGVTRGRPHGQLPVIGIIHKGKAEQIEGKKGAKLVKLPYLVFDTPQTEDLGQWLRERSGGKEITEVPIKFPRSLFVHAKTNEECINAVLDAWMVRRDRAKLCCRGDGQWVQYHDPDGDPNDTWPAVRDGFVLDEGWDKEGQFVVRRLREGGEIRYSIRCDAVACPWRQWKKVDVGGGRTNDTQACSLKSTLFFEVDGYSRYAGVYGLRLGGLATEHIASQLAYIVNAEMRLHDLKLVLHWTEVEYHHPRWGATRFHAPRLSPPQRVPPLPTAADAIAELYGEYDEPHEEEDTIARDVADRALDDEEQDAPYPENEEGLVVVDVDEDEWDLAVEPDGPYDESPAAPDTEPEVAAAPDTESGVVVAPTTESEVVIPRESDIGGGAWWDDDDTLDAD